MSCVGEPVVEQNQGTFMHVFIRLATAALALGITTGLDLKGATQREKKAYYNAPEVRADFV